MQEANNLEKNNKKLAELMTDYNELVDQIFRFIYFKTSSKEIAEDLTQECFLSTIKYLNPSIDSGQEKRQIENMRAFLFRSARNKVIDYYRQKGRVIYSDEMVLANEKISGHDDVVSKQDAKMIAEKLRLLNDEDRDILVMRYLEDMDIGDIAKVVGKNQVAVRVQIFRALKKMKKLI